MVPKRVFLIFTVIFLHAFQIACFLNPKTYRQMNDDVKDEAQQCIINEANKRKLSYRTISLAHTSSNTNISTLSNKYSIKNDDQLNRFLTGCGLEPLTISSTSVHLNTTIQQELTYYISKVPTCTTFEEFWTTHERELPCLSVLVRSFNIRPATSVPSESLFSIASYVNRKQRSSLSADTLRYSMILRDSELLATLI